MQIRWLRSAKLSGFPGVAETHQFGSPDLYGLPGCDLAFGITGRLVPTTLTRGKDDHHRAAFLMRSVEIYFGRSEFWTGMR